MELPEGLGDVALRSLVSAVVLIMLFFVAWLQFHAGALKYRVQNKDKKWPAVSDPNERKSRGRIVQTRTATLYFIRHGESCWNFTFNRAKVLMLFRLIYTCLYEMYLGAVKGDSWIIDSPLCREGVRQAESVREFIKNNKAKPGDAGRHAAILNHESDKASLLVASNLRRCISTCLIGFHDRLRAREERVVVLPSLQEITVNPDGLSISKPFAAIEASWFDAEDRAVKSYDMKKKYATQLDTSENSGNKALDSNGFVRMQAFNQWLFNKAGFETVIVAGHSLWFRSYFETYLPHSFHHAGKKKKMQNGAIVTMTVDCFTMEDGEEVYMIQPDSIQEVHRGFKK